MDGETLGNVIKQDPQLKHTLLVMLASMGTRGDASRFQRAGFSAYFPKPIEGEELYDCLTAISGRGGKTSKKFPIITRHTIAESRRRNLRILLAEESVTNRRVTLAILEKLGFRTDVAATGKEAVASSRSTTYDLVLMDCNMPDIDGYTATRLIRKEEKSKGKNKIPVIAMTVEAREKDIKKCIDAGMNDTIAKPLVPSRLAEIIEKWR
ncbi:MAG: response regulator [bacterium]|nr:response regulator [bacterium]